MPQKHYIFFTHHVLPQAAAHLVHDVHSANAVANLGYPAVLAYLQRGRAALNPVNWIRPFQPRTADPEIVQFYQIQDRLKVVPLAVFPEHWTGKWANPSTLVCKYYFPVHLFAVTGVLHTLHWNLVKAAVRNRIPVIYEREHYQDAPYDPEIVNSPFFRVAVTVADPIRDNMIRNGMPPEKILKLHLGYNKAFLERKPEQAKAWRQKLLSCDRQQLVVYSGALFKFKGVNLLMDVATALPHVQFAFAGGDEEQVADYQKLAKAMNLSNVKFLGHLPHGELVGLLQAADVLAHPHLSGEAATFTSPLKFFDYMAAGVPIVATEIPPLMEFKQSNVVSGWCSPDDPAAFAQCLQSVLEHHSARPEGNAAGMKFVQQFSWENRLLKILSFVEDVLPQSASASIQSSESPSQLLI